MTEQVKAGVSGNSALVEWPRDEWAIMTEAKAALLESARRVRGNDEKFAVFQATLVTALKHAQARLKDDKEALVLALADEEAAIERRNRGRVQGNAV